MSKTGEGILNAKRERVVNGMGLAFRNRRLDRGIIKRSLATNDRAMPCTNSADATCRQSKPRDRANMASSTARLPRAEASGSQLVYITPPKASKAYI